MKILRIHILIQDGSDIVPCVTKEVNVILQLFMKMLN